MSYRKYEIARDYILLAILAFGLFTMIAAFTMDILNPAPAPRKFEIVDKYNSCNVIRYISPSNEWIYFLDCSPTKSVASKALE
jgi:hypothetical protein